MKAADTKREALHLLCEFVYGATVQYPDGRVELERYCPDSGDNDGVGIAGCIYCGGEMMWEDHLRWAWFKHEPGCTWVRAAIFLDEHEYRPAPSTLVTEAAP